MESGTVLREVNQVMRTIGVRVLLSLAALIVSVGSAFAQIDLEGNWVQKTHEDWIEEAPGPDLVDYLGLPINEAARTRALSYSASQLSLPERQCLYYGPNYLVGGLQGIKFWAETDPTSGQVVAWVIGPAVDRGMHKIWMDGRARPNDLAPRPIGGFTTGEWRGQTLVARTTHMREAYLRRNGTPLSDQATMTLYISRYEDTLVLLGRIEDPVYLTEPFVVSRNYVLSNTQIMSTAGTPCTPAVELAELDGSGVVPHYLPGQNAAETEVGRTYGLPQEAVLGGAATMYPEFRLFLKDRYVAPNRCTRYCCGWQGNGSNALNLGCTVTAAP
jgi:hypothetical protein